MGHVDMIVSIYLQISTIHDNCVISDNTPPRATAAKYPLLIVRSFGMLRSGRRCTRHDWRLEISADIAGHGTS